VIFDAHCHIWERWPYQPAVPDPGRGSADCLLFEMDRTGVDRAIVICAAIGGNDDNNLYASEAARKSDGRLVPFLDIDSRWLSTHQTTGAAERLRSLVQRFAPRGITHYMHETADASWLNSSAGLAFLREAQAHRLILSLACGPEQLAEIVKASAHVRQLPILLHHLIRVTADDAAALEKAVAAAEAPNLHVKISGFSYGVRDGWDFPLAAMLPIVEALHAAFGARRLLWGSDWPVSTRFITHRQALEILRRHCAFIPEADMALTLGGNMERLLTEASS
jgi:predicted TIM-barrel fold metal-dependent hydrolase